MQTTSQRMFESAGSMDEEELSFIFQEDLVVILSCGLEHILEELVFHKPRASDEDALDDFKVYVA